MSDLREKAVRSGKDTIVIAVLEKVIAFAQLFLLARLLNPEAFGVFAMAMALVIAGTVFTSLGTERILIQRHELDDSFVGSIWLAELGRGFLVSLLCVVLAPYYALWMHAPDVEQVLYFLAWIPFLSSLQTPAVIIAERNLLFRQVVLFQIFSGLIQFLILIALAYVYADVFALAVGFTMMAIVRSLFSWAWFGLQYRPSFNRAHFQELLSTGKHYFVIALGGYAMTQGDNLMIGNMLGAVMLGYYVMAYQISQWPVDILSRVVGRVALPVFSRLQQDAERLHRAFDQVLQVQLLFLVPIIVGIFFFAPLIVPMVLGSDYTPSIVILQLMTVMIVGRGMSHVLDPFIIGTGFVSFASKVKVFETGVFLVAVWYGMQAYGVEGAAVGAGVGYVFAAGVRIIFVCRSAKYSVLMLGKRLLLPLMASFVGIMAAMGLHYTLHAADIIMFITEGAVFTMVYILVSVLLDRTWLIKLKELWHSKSGA